LQPPLLIPHGVTVSGDSMTTTALYFSQQSINGTYTSGTATSEQGAISALIGAQSPQAKEANQTVTFAVHDLCIYALSFYSTVVNISSDTTGVAIRRVRIRANAFNGRNSGPDRVVPWQSSIGSNGPPVVLLQGHSAEISNCDIWATWVAIASHGSYGNHYVPPSGEYVCDVTCTISQPGLTRIYHISELYSKTETADVLVGAGTTKLCAHPQQHNLERWRVLLG
jgi:hypothetical protein